MVVACLVVNVDICFDIVAIVALDARVSWSAVAYKCTRGCSLTFSSCSAFSARVTVRTMCCHTGCSWESNFVWNGTADRYACRPTQCMSMTVVVVYKASNVSIVVSYTNVIWFMHTL